MNATEEPVPDAPARAAEVPVTPPQLTVSPTTNRITKERFNNTDYNYTYDNAGNLKYDRVCSDYSYDAENRLVSATCGGATATYAYDGAGRRVKKIAAGSTTLYFYSGNTPIAERVADHWKDYLYSRSAQLATIEDGAPTKYWHQDHLSNRVATEHRTAWTFCRPRSYPRTWALGASDR